MSKGLSICKQAINCTALSKVTGFSFTGQQPDGTSRFLVFSLGATRVSGSKTYSVTTNSATGDTITVSGVKFTAVASGATTLQFNVGSSLTATAANIVTAINANTSLSALFTATSTNGDITITEKNAGYGNTPTDFTVTGSIKISTSSTVTSVPEWFKLNIASGVATMSMVTTQDLTVDSVLAEGNTVTELSSVTSIPEFAGKGVYYAVAFSAPSSSLTQNLMPTLGISIVGSTGSDTFSYTETSAEYSLSNGDEVEVVSVTAETAVTGRASVVVTASLKQNGVWTEFMSLTSIKNLKASAVKYKAIHTVSVINGDDSSKVKSVSITYCSGSDVVSGDSAELITVTEEYNNGLSFVQCLVKHKALIDAQIKAYASFRSKPTTSTKVSIATGTGETQTVVLPVTGVNHNTLRLYANDVEMFDFGFNTETDSVTFTADKGAAITMSCESGWESESWNEMTNQGTQSYSDDTGVYATKFTYALPSGTTGKTVSNVKIVLYRPTGVATNVSLGKATGNRQFILLPHKMQKETMTCTGSWSYNEDEQILTVIADKDVEISYSGNWVAETAEVKGLTVGWAE